MHRLIPLLMFLCCAGTAVAQPEISPISLVGRWTTEAKHPNGATIAVDVVLAQNLKFRGSSTVDGKPFLEYGGTWSVTGNTLTWRYETSSGLSPAPGTTDSDEIVSVDVSRLILRSKLSGKQHEYIRIR